MTYIDPRIRRRLSQTARLVPALVLFACIEFKDADTEKTTASDSAAAAPVTFDPNDISAPSYESFALDTAGTGERLARLSRYDSSFKRISPATAAASIGRFPASIPPQGPATLHIQILLDRAGFSPGILDGGWGDNAAHALKWFRVANGIDTASAGSTDSSAALDEATYQRLTAATGSAPVMTHYIVTAEDLQGPFVQIPERVYDQAELPCMCYSTPAEAIAERFHTSEKVLAQLNPRVQMASLRTGARLMVPNVAEDDGTPPRSPADTSRSSDSAAQRAGPSRDTAARQASGAIARLIVSRTGFWLHAVDASGKVLYHFPSTLGAGYDPSPTGDYRITNIAQDPTFHYQPKLFAEVSDDKPEARLPKGPNSPVGVVWMAISKPHYGIHGTSAPETIGYENSHGCVRLTNWDARKLSRLVSAGTPVEFQ
ncbi:MAG: L,D-transpeptidase [Gemmatimonadaceae bacterium]|nr:L,D-transpeptidase [Gemmatimonadaceae bacterium]